MIVVASIKKPKVEAVKEIIKEYDVFAEAEVVGMEVDTGVSEQPMTLDETVQGAINRAKAAWTPEVNLSVGIESGFIEVSASRTGSMNIVACVIYDGEQAHLGISSAFELPEILMKTIKEKGIAMSEACYVSGLTDDPDIGASRGIISVLTKGRLDRKNYIKEALRMALIHIENKDLTR